MSYRNGRWILLAALLASAVAPAGAGSLSTIPLNYGHTGSWFEPLSVGQGFLMEVVPETNTFVVSWFSYAGAQDSPAFPSGSSEQRWYFAQGEFADGDHVVTLDVLRPQGGRFAVSAAAAFPSVGSAQLSFDSCDSGMLSYSFTDSGLTGEIALTRLFPDGICAQFLDPATNGEAR